MGMMMTAVVLVAAFTGVVSLQKSYSATEELRHRLGRPDAPARLPRARPAACRRPAHDGPRRAGRPDRRARLLPLQRQRRAAPLPRANDAVLNTTGDAAVYADPRRALRHHADDRLPLLAGSITRADPWQPLVANGQGGYVSSGPVTIASNMDAFPTSPPTPPTARARPCVTTSPFTRPSSPWPPPTPATPSPCTTSPSSAARTSRTERDAKNIE